MRKIRFEINGSLLWCTLTFSYSRQLNNDNKTRAFVHVLLSSIRYPSVLISFTLNIQIKFKWLRNFVFVVFYCYGNLLIILANNWKNCLNLITDNNSSIFFIRVNTLWIVNKMLFMFYFLNIKCLFMTWDVIVSRWNSNCMQ